MPGLRQANPAAARRALGHHTESKKFSSHSVLINRKKENKYVSCDTSLSCDLMYCVLFIWSTCSGNNLSLNAKERKYFSGLFSLPSPS